MLNEKDVNIISVCDELSKHKETSHLVEKVADDLFKPAENVTTEKLYDEYNNMLAYIKYKKEWVDSHWSEFDMANAEALYENSEESADMTFEEYIEEYGINGMIYSCYEEFCDEEIDYYREPSIYGYSVIIQSEAFNDNGYDVAEEYYSALGKSPLYHDELTFNVSYLEDRSGDDIDAIQIDFASPLYDIMFPQYDRNKETEQIVKPIIDALNKSKYPLSNGDYDVVTVCATVDFNNTHSFADAIEQYLYERGEYDYNGSDVLPFVDRNKDRYITTQLINALLQKKDYSSLINYFDAEVCTAPYFNDCLGDVVSAQHYLNALQCFEKTYLERNQPEQEKTAEYDSYFEVYQMKDRGNRFFNFTHQTTETLKSSEFKCVYKEPIDSQQEISNDFLENLYSRFNSGYLPSNFKGHSLSISDVILVHKSNDFEKAFFVDSFDFKDISDLFLENHEQGKEHKAKQQCKHSIDTLQL